MIDFDEIPSEILLARGKYSTVRAEHEDEKKRLQLLCGQLMNIPAQILKNAQSDDGENVGSVADLITLSRSCIDMIEQSAQRIDALAKQRAELKAEAWRK